LRLNENLTQDRKNFQISSLFPAIGRFFSDFRELEHKDPAGLGGTMLGIVKNC
jgi:hypothetical protein